MQQNKVNRRQFLGASTAGTAAVLGAPAIVRAGVPSDLVRVAVIGVGGMGGGQLHDLIKRSKNPEEKVKVVAVCDVWDKRLEDARRACQGKAYKDYRRLLENSNVDAVVIATPDHWHAPISMDAMQAGKEVYCQKPMTLHWEEAKKVYQCQRRTKRVFQCGAQGTSEDKLWKARDAIKSGALGKLIWSQCSYLRNVPSGDWNWPIDDSANPTNLDWKMWLGPAREVPFSPDRYFRFRKYWDYSGGLATDLLYHVVAETMTALGPEFPTRVVASGGNYVLKEREVPDTFHALINFPGDHTLLAVSTQNSTEGFGGTIIRGQKATLKFEGPGCVVEPQEPWKGLVKRREVATAERPDHMTNWLRCIREQAPEKCHLDALAAYKVMVAIDLATRSYRTNKVMLFDPVRQEMVG
jgi:predicted dehydrogenase